MMTLQHRATSVNHASIKAASVFAGIQLGAVISTVDGCYENIGKVTVDQNTSVDVVFVPRDFTDDAWKNVRRSILRVDEGFQAKALVMLTGTFGIYSNTYGLYFRAKSIGVVSSFP